MIAIASDTVSSELPFNLLTTVFSVEPISSATALLVMFLRRNSNTIFPSMCFLLSDANLPCEVTYALIIHLAKYFVNTVFTFQGNYFLDNYVTLYYNIVLKGGMNMDFLDRLRLLMNQNGDNNSTLAKKSGTPYTTIDGLFKRGWEKAQISTIQRICTYYGVSLDYMIYGASKLSAKSQMLAAKFDNLDEPGKDVVMAVTDLQIKRIEAYGSCIPVKEPLDTIADFAEKNF